MYAQVYTNQVIQNPHLLFPMPHLSILTKIALIARKGVQQCFGTMENIIYQQRENDYLSLMSKGYSQIS